MRRVVNRRYHRKRQCDCSVFPGNLWVGPLAAAIDAPDEDGGDFNGIAALVVDLEFVAVEVAGAQGNLGCQAPVQHVFNLRLGASVL